MVWSRRPALWADMSPPQLSRNNPVTTFPLHHKPQASHGQSMAVMLTWRDGDDDLYPFRSWSWGAVIYLENSNINLSPFKFMFCCLGRWMKFKCRVVVSTATRVSVDSCLTHQRIVCGMIGGEFDICDFLSTAHNILKTRISLVIKFDGDDTLLSGALQPTNNLFKLCNTCRITTSASRTVLWHNTNWTNTLHAFQPNAFSNHTTLSSTFPEQHGESHTVQCDVEPVPSGVPRNTLRKTEEFLP